MGNILFIRPAGAQDMEAIGEISRDCLPEEGYSLQQYEESLAYSYTLFLTAWKKDELVGFALGSCVAGDCHLDLLAIKDSCRRKGYGKQLMQAFLSEGKKNGSEIISLEVRASNEPAIRLYQSFGLSIAGTRKRFYENPVEDALILQKVEETTC